MAHSSEDSTMSTHLHTSVEAAEGLPPRSQPAETMADPSPDFLLGNLPVELIDAILSYLSPLDVVAVSATCSALRRLAQSDTIWQPLVQANVPGVTVKSPYPFRTFLELYAAHDPQWFLPRYKLWFCDRDLAGKLVIARYDQRRGCIEGHQLVAVCENHPEHAFQPRVTLHLDKPVLRLNPNSRRDLMALQGGDAHRWFAPEVPMPIHENPENHFSNFQLARDLGPEEASSKSAEPFPYGCLWPPPAVPAPARVRGSPNFYRNDHLAIERDDLPLCRSEASEKTFRIRSWIEMTGSPRAARLMLNDGLNSMVQTLTGLATPPPAAGLVAGEIAGGVRSPLAGLMGTMGVHLGEEVTTYSTLDPELYTPTETKPWRGIWVGDYNTHGCEFLLIHQPDDEGPPPTDEELGLVRGEGEADEEWERRRREARVYRGRLEAVKLTGDPYVPRGERTFVVDDLSQSGYLRDPPLFHGVRCAHSKGHVANLGFRDDRFVRSGLLLFSHDRIAQMWHTFGHISFFERVDIDRFLDPEQPVA